MRRRYAYIYTYIHIIYIYIYNLSSTNHFSQYVKDMAMHVFKEATNLGFQPGIPPGAQDAMLVRLYMGKRFLSLAFHVSKPWGPFDCMDLAPDVSSEKEQSSMCLEMQTMCIHKAVSTSSVLHHTILQQIRAITMVMNIKITMKTRLFGFIPHFVLNTPLCLYSTPPHPCPTPHPK